MPPRRIRAHPEPLSEFNRGCTIGLKVGQVVESLVIKVEAMQPLEDAGKENFRFHRQNGSSRPRATTDQEDRLIARSTIRRVTRTRVSIITIHKWLIERNLSSYRPLRHLPLTPAHYRARLQ
ncbi:HTH_Tnp_Tc3_2 domain-containing protein [Trichonephila clavipes]|nr:HTH_Tnp_Tc3_2 domain-containing protein [Trichonephila clavipes]